MPLIAGEWRDHSPLETRQFVFAHHTPIPGLHSTVIPNQAALRMVGNIVRDIGEHGCWGYLQRRNGYQKIIFLDAAGEKQHIKSNRFALLLRDDAPIPPGRTANHSCPNKWCIHPGHIYLGTQTENMLDAYADGRRGYRPALHLDESREAYARLRADRAARQGREIRCQRFFCEEIRAELAATSRPSVMAEAA